VFSLVLLLRLKDLFVGGAAAAAADIGGGLVKLPPVKKPPVPSAVGTEGREKEFT